MSKYPTIRGDHFRFGSVRFLSKKVTKPKFFFEKKTETGSNRPVSVRFGFLGQKPVQTGLARFFQFWLGFLGFGSVFFGLARFFWFGSVLARFFRFGSVFFRFFVSFGSVRLGFFLIKPKPNLTGRFFQKFNRFNRFLFSVRFFQLFFSGFLGLIGFPVFLLTPKARHVFQVLSESLSSLFIVNKWLV